MAPSWSMVRRCPLARLKQQALQRRLLQKRGLTIDLDRPIRERYRPKAAVRNGQLKTPRMLLVEIQFNQDIEDILVSGPLHCQQTLGVRAKRGSHRCGRCIQCRYHINYSTASKWRKRLGIPRWVDPGPQPNPFKKESSSQ